jgi:hypothetical protein
MSKSNNVDTETAANDNREFASFAHSFRDPWKDAEVELNFRFARPTRTQIKRLSDTAGKNTLQASRDLLIGTIHPEEKDELLNKLEEYPGLSISFSSALIKTVGITADLGN